MAQKKAKTNRNKSNGGNLGFEEKLWQAADKMRGHMDPAEYKHVVLGLIFLKYISDAFEEKHSLFSKETADPKSDYYSPNSDERFHVVEDRDGICRKISSSFQRTPAGQSCGTMPNNRPSAS